MLSSKTALRLLMLGMFVSAVGTSLSSMGFFLLAAQTGRSSLLAAVLVANLLPSILLGLVGGYVADRYLTRWLWPLSLLFTAGIMTAMAITLRWEVIIAGCALMSSCTALVGPVAQKLIAHYSSDAAATGSTLATVQGAAGVLGVALGGVSFGAGALQLMLLADALAMLLLALVGFAVSRPEAITLDGPGEKFRPSSSLRLISSPSVFGALGILLIITTVTSTSLDDVSGVFALTHELGLSPAQYGITSAAWALGIMLGSVAGRYLREDARARYPWATLPIGVAIGAVGILQPGFWGIILLFTLGGAGNGYFNAITNRIILSSVSDAQQGRAWAGFRWVVYTCLLVGYTIGAVVGASHALLLMSVSGCVLVGCAALNIVVRGRVGRKSG